MRKLYFYVIEYEKVTFAARSTGHNGGSPTNQTQRATYPKLNANPIPNLHLQHHPVRLQSRPLNIPSSKRASKHEYLSFLPLPLSSNCADQGVFV